MAEPLAEAAAPGTHVIEYRVFNQRPDDPPRRVVVHASPEELRGLDERGYLVRERLFQGEALERLRAACDRLEAREREIRGPGEGLSTGRDFGGLFLRHLMDKDQAFLDLLRFPPTLSVARAMLGPLVQIRGMTARITYPGDAHQETHWHQHLRVVPTPLPPWFSRPHGLDVLIYLDDLDEATGPLCVLPGSHHRLDTEPPPHLFEDLPGQQTLYLPAGSAVLLHPNLWHRARPTTAQGHKRRLLIIGYAPTWLRAAPYGVKPADGLTRALLEGADEETRELLGTGGYT